MSRPPCVSWAGAFACRRDDHFRVQRTPICSRVDCATGSSITSLANQIDVSPACRTLALCKSGFILRRNHRSGYIMKHAALAGVHQHRIEWGLLYFAIPGATLLQREW